MRNPDAPEDLLRRSLAIAAGLAALKLWAGARSSSLGVLASALDSLTDLSASALNLLSLRLSARPPDEEHPYGWGKTEALAGLVQAVLIAAGAAALLAESVRRFLGGARVDAGAAALGAMAVSAAASLWHGRRLAAASAATGSTVLRTETAHFAADAAANSGVIAALLAARWTGSALWDLAVSVPVSAYVLRGALRVLADCGQELLDRKLPAESLRAIEEAIRSHDPRVAGFHELRTRRAGRKVFIDFHVVLRGVERFEDAHEITESLIDKLKRLFPGSDVTAHYDPEGGR